MHGAEVIEGQNISSLEINYVVDGLHYPVVQLVSDIRVDAIALPLHRVGDTVLDGQQPKQEQQ